MKRNGFTLLEVLVAISLLFIVLSIVYGAFSTHVKAVERCKAIEDRYQIARMILSQMIYEINGAYLNPDSDIKDIHYELVGIEDEVDGYPRDSLHFISSYQGATFDSQPRGALKEIGYFVVPDPNTEVPLLIRREDQTPDEDPSSGGNYYILGEKIKGLKFLYYNQNGEEKETWDSNESKRLPKTIKVTIILENDEEEGEFFSTLIILPMANRVSTGNGY